MSAYLFTALFYLLLFLLMCGTLLCGHVCVSGEAPSPAAENPAKVFATGEKIGEVFKPTDGSAKETDVEDVKVEEFYSPALVSCGDVIVALAAIKGDTVIDNNITVLTKYIDTSNAGWKEKVFKESGDAGWEKQFAVYGAGIPAGGDSVVRGLVAAAVKNKKIYLLLVNASTTTGNELTLTFWRAVGTVNTGNGNKITWEEKKLTPSTSQDFTEKIKGYKLIKGVFSGSALVTKNKAIFLLTARTDDQKNVFGFFYLDDVGTADNIKFLPSDVIAQGCYPQFFLWEEKIIMVPTQCAKEVTKQKVMKETTDFTTMKDWKESSGPFSRFVDFFQDKGDFTTVSIKNENTNNNDVLLFTQKKKPKQPPTTDDNCDVYLWATDGNHSYRAKKILTNVGDAPISLLYTNNELLALYQKQEATKPKTIALTQLKTQLSDITIVIEAWKSNGGIVEKLCNDKTLCDTPPPTDGLVGFLHSIINEEGSQKIIWKDEYYYSDVTVEKEKAENATNGLKFSGTGKRAEWSMKIQQEEKVYNFITSGFTLVATVEIGSDTNGKKNSILGVTLEGNTNNNVGLWCTRNGEWGVSGRDGSALKLSGKECKQGNTYNVALVLHENGNLDIYVNGEQLTTEKITILPPENIENFYFGANVDSDESYVTVTNVLLYNRPFNPGEIGKLKEYIRTVEAVTPPDQAVGTNTTGGNSDEPTPPPIPTSTKGKGEDEKGPSPTRTEDGGVGGGVRVFSLLLALLCVSAPLLHL